MGLTIHQRSKGKLLASDGPVLYSLHSHEAESSPDDVPQTLAAIEAQLEQHAAVALLVIVEHGTPKPSPEERREMQATLARFGERLVVGYAFCGLGFWAGALRALIAGISRLAGSPAIMHQTVEDTAAALARELIGLDPQRITGVGEELRAQLGTELPSKLASG